VSVAQNLNALFDPSKMLKHTELLEFSDIPPEDSTDLARAWIHIHLDRRRKLVAQLSQLAEEDVLLDFTTIFKLALQDPDAEVREQSISSLWECEDTELISTFIDLMKNDDSDHVRAAATQALGNFAVLAEDYKLLPKEHARIRQALLDVAHNNREDPNILRRAVEAISPFSDTEVWELILSTYQSPVLELRRNAIFSMGRNAHPEWIPIIISEMANPDPAMRYEAVSAFANVGSKSNLAHILPLIQDEDREVRLAAVHALGNIGGPTAKKALTSCIQSSDDALRDAASAALEQTNYTGKSLPFDFRS
jgi:HEAT repeat protein